MSCSSVGFATLPEPLRGSWLLHEQTGAMYFPASLDLMGRRFTRSTTWAAPLPHVVAQYREDVDRDSMHLEVMDDHTWRIDHVDAANPERGLVLEHTLRDVIHTTWGAVLLAAAVVSLSAGVSYALTRRSTRALD